MKRWFRISIRDICWLTVVVALSVCVYQGRVTTRHVMVENDALKADLNATEHQVDTINREVGNYVAKELDWLKNAHALGEENQQLKAENEHMRNTIEVIRKQAVKTISE